MKVTKFFFKSVLFLGLIIVTTQDITGRKNCDCSICKGTDNKIGPIVGKKFDDGDGGKSTCNICEHKKRMLQEEKERQEKLQKCPFEILGSANIKGKSSDEVFDEFRELVIPSQNGFFDMMRGVVKTIHVSSEQELKWAKEKEARELAKKKKEEEERKKLEAERKPDELVGANPALNPKVTVVLKQTPCGQIIPQIEGTGSQQPTLMRRLPKDANDNFETENEDEILQRIQLLPDFDIEGIADEDLLNIDLNENLLNSNLLQKLVGYKEWITEPPQEEATESPTLPADLYQYREGENDIEPATESPYVKFMTDEELKAQLNGVLPDDATNMVSGLLPKSSEIVTENTAVDVKFTTQSVDSNAQEQITTERTVVVDGTI